MISGPGCSFEPCRILLAVRGRYSDVYILSVNFHTARLCEDELTGLAFSLFLSGRLDQVQIGLQLQ